MNERTNEADPLAWATRDTTEAIEELRLVSARGTIVALLLPGALVGKGARRVWSVLWHDSLFPRQALSSRTLSETQYNTGKYIIDRGSCIMPILYFYY